SKEHRFPVGSARGQEEAIQFFVGFLGSRSESNVVRRRIALGKILHKLSETFGMDRIDICQRDSRSHAPGPNEVGDEIDLAVTRQTLQQPRYQPADFYLPLGGVSVQKNSEDFGM